LSKTKNQSGSMHLIIIIAVVVIVIGGLGFVVWNNFIKPKIAAEQVEKLIEENKVVALTEIAYNIKDNSNISLKYPETWSASRSTLGDGSILTDISSADGNMTVNFDILSGTATDSYVCDTNGSSSLSLTKLDTDLIPGLNGYRFVSFVGQQSKAGTNELTYKYYVGLQSDSDVVKAIKVGDSLCGFSNSATYNLGSSKLQVYLRFNNVAIDKSDTLSNFNNQIESPDYVIAKRIIQSLTVISN